PRTACRRAGRAAGGRSAAGGAALARRSRAERRPGGHRAPAPRLRCAARRRPGMVVTVRDVRVVPFAIPLRRPLATAFGSVALRRGFLVVLSGADGHVGLREAT